MTSLPPCRLLSRSLSSSSLPLVPVSSNFVMKRINRQSMMFALGSIPWLITAELFSQGPRPAAMSIAVLANWLTNFLVGLLYPFQQVGLNQIKSKLIIFTYCFSASSSKLLIPSFHHSSGNILDIYLSKSSRNQGPVNRRDY